MHTLSAGRKPHKTSIVVVGAPAPAACAAPTPCTLLCSAYCKTVLYDESSQAKLFTTRPILVFSGLILIILLKVLVVVYIEI